MYLTQDFGGADIECQPCAVNEATASDGWSCVECDAGNTFNPITKQCTPCVETQVAGMTTDLYLFYWQKY